MDNFARLAETLLPPQEEFFSHLSDEGISDEDYGHACKVWVIFAMCTLKEYHDCYLETDLTFLADVFEVFRAMALEAYKLDPLHYYSSPGLSFDACLKMSKVPLDLFTTPDKSLFTERGMRGGVSMISNRYAKANNPYLNQGYDKHKPNNYIMYLDCTNLYRYAMSEPLPTGKFRFLDQEEICSFDVLTKMDEDVKVYILDVDLEYPHIFTINTMTILWQPKRLRSRHTCSQHTCMKVPRSWISTPITTTTSKSSSQICTTRKNMFSTIETLNFTFRWVWSSSKPIGSWNLSSPNGSSHILFSTKRSGKLQPLPLRKICSS